MWHSLLPLFQWSDNLWIGHAISGTTWAFPLIETIHILAMAVMYATMMLVLLVVALRFVNPTQLVARVKEDVE